MRLLLTSAGIKNASIRDALVALLGTPIADCDALCIPTALYGHPYAGPRQAWKCISGNETGTPTVGLGWKSMGVLELTALPSLDDERWVPLVREVDVLLVEGGDAAYLCHWMLESGLADLLPELRDTVWVGVSGGSMVSHGRTLGCRHRRRAGIRDRRRDRHPGRRRQRRRHLGRRLEAVRLASPTSR